LPLSDFKAEFGLVNNVSRESFQNVISHFAD